jgi:hypothetical protein
MSLLPFTPLIRPRHSLTLAGHGPSRSLPSGSIVEGLQVVLAQLTLSLPLSRPLEFAHPAGRARQAYQ